MWVQPQHLLHPLLSPHDGVRKAPEAATLGVASLPPPHHERGEGGTEEGGKVRAWAHPPLAALEG